MTPHKIIFSEEDDAKLVQLMIERKRVDDLVSAGADRHKIADLRKEYRSELEQALGHPIYRMKSKDEWFKDLTMRAESYWKSEEANGRVSIPRKGSMSWLLIPKYGVDMTQNILAVRTYMKDDSRIRKLVFGVE